MQVQATVHIPNAEDAARRSVINICLKHWINSGISTAYAVVTAERRWTRANASFSREIFFARLIFFGKAAVTHWVTVDSR